MRRRFQEKHPDFKQGPEDLGEKKTIAEGEGGEIINSRKENLPLAVTDRREEIFTKVTATACTLVE